MNRLCTNGLDFFIYEKTKRFAVLAVRVSVECAGLLRRWTGGRSKDDLTE